jgi:hypothetical protein
VTQRGALGFSLHCGWGVAALVALASTDDKPRLIDRRRVDLEPESYPVQMYHAASGLDIEQARRLVDGARSAAEAAATRALRDLVAQAEATGIHVREVGLATVPRPTLDELDRILTFHPRMHRAEGDLYRDALVDAAASLGLQATLSSPAQLHDLAAAALDCDVAAIERLLAQYGRAVGPPWQQDHKLATLAALTVLDAQSSS